MHKPTETRQLIAKTRQHRRKPCHNQNHKPGQERNQLPAAKLDPGAKVNINALAKVELEALPGSGPAKADAVIVGRSYAKREDIMKVKEIKKGTYDRIKELITVQQWR